MFDYTQIVLKKIRRDLDKIAFTFGVISQAFSIVYLIYVICAGTGILWVNIAVLVLSAFCLALHFPMGADIKKTAKKRLKRFKRYFKWISLAVRLCPVIIAVYAIAATGSSPDAISVLLTAFTVISWVLQLVLQIVLYLFDKYAALVREGVSADVEEITRPVRAVTSFFKKSPEPEEEKAPTKTRLWLDEQVEAVRADRAEQKLKEKQEKKENKIQAKADKKQAKKDRKSAKKQAKKEKKET
ncbi:MAG: hypothetical protein IJX91_02995 [Clostridia bacterium]|nr:hypothetical protein [Clostridia bacterium]